MMLSNVSLILYCIDVVYIQPEHVKKIDAHVQEQCLQQAALDQIHMSAAPFFVTFLEDGNLGEDEPLIKFCNNSGYNVMKRIMNDRTSTMMVGDVDSQEESLRIQKTGSMHSREESMLLIICS